MATPQTSRTSPRRRGNVTSAAGRRRHGRRAARTLVAGVLALTLSVAGALAVCSPSLASTRAGLDRAENRPAKITLRRCNETALDAAIAKGGTVVFKCSGTIVIDKTIVVPKGTSLTLSARGRDVELEGHQVDPASITPQLIRVFDVEGGSLTLVDLAVDDSEYYPGSGTSGAHGGAGTPGTAGTGDAGSAGSPGGSGTSGKAAEGGAMYIAKGSTVQIRYSSFDGDAAFGADGGDGGNGGAGGNGGSGTSPSTGDGGDGGTGGDGGNGGSGAPGRPGLGGAIYNLGTLTLVEDSFALDFAGGGSGGRAGSGGADGSGGNGGDGGSGGSGNSTGGNGGSPGPLPGQPGQAGRGAEAEGGAVYNAGVLAIAASSFEVDIAQGGQGGDGGQGGAGPEQGGNGGDGGSGQGDGSAGDGASGAACPDGTAGANAGSAYGGAIYSVGSLQLSAVTFGRDTALGGEGGDGGQGCAGGAAGSGASEDASGGNGGNGGPGGDAGAAAGGAVYAEQTVPSDDAVAYTSDVSEALPAGAGGSGGPGGQGEGGGSGSTGTAGAPGKASEVEDDDLSGEVSPGLTVTKASLADAEVGQAYSGSVEAAHGSRPYHWSVISGSLPRGLDLSKSTGRITGTPTRAGTCDFTLLVRDSSALGAVSVAELSIVVSPRR